MAENQYVWFQPTLIAEIKLRHAFYKGLREVQDNAAIYEINNWSAAINRTSRSYAPAATLERSLR